MQVTGFRKRRLEE